MALTPYPSDPQLVNVAKAYKNQAYVADLILPVVNTITQSFKYNVFSKKEKFTIPDTRVSRKGTPNEVNFTSQELTDAVEGYGLVDRIPITDINDAPAGRNLVNESVVNLTDLILLDKEKLMADLVFADNGTTASITARYGSNTATNATTTQWQHSSSDPIGQITDAKDSLLMGANIAVMGRVVWSQLRQHASVMKAINGNAGDSGLAARRAVADLLELDDIIIGAPWYNSANKGQTATMARMWGLHCALLYVEKVPEMANKRISWGFQAKYDTWEASQQPDADIGLKGGIKVKVGEYRKLKTISTDCGYFIKNAASTT